MIGGGAEASRQVDVGELLNPSSADRALAAAFASRSDLADAIAAKADMAARLKDDLAGIGKTDRAVIAGGFVGLGSTKLVAQADVLLVGLLGRLVEEERR